MITLAAKAVRYPKTAIAIWLALAAGLGLLGARIDDHLSPSVLSTPGTESSRADKLAAEKFGASVLTPVMLQGPKAQLDKQGPALARALRARGDTRVLSPWDDTPGVDVLRPKPGSATIVAAIERDEEYVIQNSLDDIERTVDRVTTGDVHSHITGQAVIDRAMRDESLDSARLGVLIALPAILAVLLVLMGAPVAAAVATLFAASVLPVGYGLTAIAARVIEVDAVAVAGASIVGLALGVGFAVMIIGRFREELARAAGPEPAAAAVSRSIAATGRTVLLAATGLVGAMLIASSLSIPDILNSVGIGATLMAVAAPIGAVAVLPAVLRLTGGQLNVLAFTPPHRRLAAMRGRRARVLGAPVAIAAGALVLLLALSAPLLSLDSGPPDPKLLPADNAARQDFEAVAAVMGPGWVTPYEIVVAEDRGAITSRTFLRRVHRFEETIHRDKAVDSILGPGALAAKAEELQGVPKGLDKSAATAKKSKKSLKTLIGGLRQATDGVGQVRAGIGSAADGARQLDDGSGRAASGAAQLHAGLAKANSGAQQLKAGAAKASSGARQLAGGLVQAESGVVEGMPIIKRLGNELDAHRAAVDGLAGATKTAKAEIDAAVAELQQMTAGREDPRFEAAAAALGRAATAAGTSTGAADAATQSAWSNSTTMKMVQGDIAKLQDGLAKLRAGGSELSAGIAKLAGGNSQLAGGLSQLEAGGGQLAAGLGQLNDGTGRLAAGLGGADGPTGELYAGMNKITGAVVESRKKIPSTAALEQLKAEVPRLFESGYWVLAALDGATGASRDAASFVVNVDRGGLGGRITVVPKAGVNAESTHALGHRLIDRAAAFERTTGADVAVGGTAMKLLDYKELGAERLPFVVIGISLLTFVLLAALARSLVLPAVAVALNLLTAAAAFGTLAMLYGGSDPVLGGPGFIDPVSMIAVMTVILGLSIDYEVFVLTRIRERAQAGGTPATAALFGIRHTASVVSIVTVVMAVAILAFAPTELAVVGQLAIGALAAVLIDGLIVRPLLLPVAMRLLGRWTWWMPRWIDRMLPTAHFGAGHHAH